MKKYLLTVAVTLGVFSAYPTLATVQSFVFSTESQVVLPGAVSKAITIESRNESGQKENLSETMDLNFKSSSNTGVFLSSSGNAVSKTMNKSTGSRTFYYKDSSAGDFIITVSLVGRESKKSFFVMQNIKIGEIDKDEIKPVPKISTLSKATASTSKEDIIVFEAKTHKSFIFRFWNFVKSIFVEQ